MAVRRFYLLWLFLLLMQAFSAIAQVDTVKEKLKFDLGFTRSRNINLWPVFKRVNTESYKELDVLFPLFVNKKDTANASTYSHFVPIYFKSKNKAYQDLRLFSFYYPSLFHYRKDSNDVKSFRLLEVVPRFSLMDVRKSKRGVYLDQNFLFFIWFKNDIVLQQAHFIVFPFSWYFKNKNDKSYTFFPLFSKGNRGKNEFMAITPLFWHFNNDKKASTTLFPVFFNRKSLDPEIKYSSTVIFPLWWSSMDFLSKKKVLFPVYWDYQILNYHSVTLFPLFSTGHSSDNRQNHRVITPLYWQYRNDRETNRILFPFWWRNINYNNKDTTLANVIFPFSWNLKSKGHHNYTLFPLFSFGYSPVSSYVAVTPFYWNRTREDGYSRTLFPVLWNNVRYRKNDTLKTNIVFPVWWNFSSRNYNNSLLFPIYGRFRGSNYQSTTVMPFYSEGSSTDGSRSHYAISPLFWHFNTLHTKTSFLLPAFYHRSSFRRNDTVRTTMVGMLWWSVINDKNHYGHMLLPVFWYSKNPSSSTALLFPLFYSYFNLNDATRVLRITPFFHYTFRDNIRTTVLFPIWWDKISLNQQVKSREFVLFPLYWSLINGDSKVKVLFPVWYSSTSDKSKSRVLFPLYWHFKETNYSSTTVIPLFSLGKSAGGELSNMMLTPLIWRKKDSNNIRFTFFPLFWYKRSEQLKYHSLLPFYFYSSSPASRNFQLLLLVYNYRRNKDQSVYNGILWKTVYWNKYSDGGHEFRLLYLLFADVRKKDLTEKSIFPIYYYSRIRNTDVTKAWFLYFYSRSTHYIPEVRDYYIEERIFWFLRIRSNYSQLQREGKAQYLKKRRIFL